MHNKTKGKNRGHLTGKKQKNKGKIKRIVYIDPHFPIIHQVPNLISNCCPRNTNIKESIEKLFIDST